jgi:hypothetical protein
MYLFRKVRTVATLKAPQVATASDEKHFNSPTALWVDLLV